MKKLRKVLIPVLVFAVVFACLFAIGASADTTMADVDEDSIALFSMTQPDGTVKTYKALTDAIKYANDGATIELLADYNAIYCFAITGTPQKNVTLDLKGHTIYLSKLKGSQYIQMKNGNGLKITSTDGKGNIVIPNIDTAAGKGFIMLDSNSNYETVQNNLSLENVDIKVNNGNWLFSVYSGVLTLKDVNINSTVTSAPIQTSGTIAGQTVKHIFENVNVTAAGQAVKVILANNTVDYVAEWRNVSLTSASSETYRIDAPKTANLRIEDSKIINTGTGLAFYSNGNMIMDAVLTNCEISAPNATQDIIRFNKVTSEGTMTFDRCTLTSGNRLFTSATSVDSDTSKATFNFKNCIIDSAKAAFVGTKITNITGRDTRIKIGSEQISFGGGSATYTNVMFGDGVRISTNNPVMSTANTGKFKADGLSYIYPYIYCDKEFVFENSATGTNSTYFNQTANTNTYGFEKIATNPRDSKAYRQLGISGVQTWHPYLNPMKKISSLMDGLAGGAFEITSSQYLTYEMDFSVNDDIPDQIDIYSMGRNEKGGDSFNNSNAYIVLRKADGGVNVTFNGETVFVPVGHWAHLTFVIGLSAESIDGVNQSVGAVFVDGQHLSTMTGIYKDGVKRVSDVRMNMRHFKNDGNETKLNVANIRSALYYGADFESNVFSANPTVEGSDYLAGAKSSMADFTEGANKIYGMKFNLTLYSNFNLNLYIPAKYLIDGETVEINGAAYTMREYRFAADEVAVAQKISLGTYDTVTVSVLDYAKVLFSLDSITDAEKTLMADALVYANAAAKLIGKTEDTAVTALLSTYASYKSEPLKEITPVEKNIDAVKNGVTAAYLDLTSQPSFVFEIVSDSGVTITYTNFRGETVKLDETAAVEGKITIRDMRIFDFAKNITITVGTNTATYSLANYAYSMKDDANTMNLCNALYTYIESARAFKAPKA